MGLKLGILIDADFGPLWRVCTLGLMYFETAVVVFVTGNFSPLFRFALAILLTN